MPPSAKNKNRRPESDGRLIHLFSFQAGEILFCTSRIRYGWISG